MKTLKYKEIETKKYLKLQDLKGEENFVEGKYVGTEPLAYSPAFLIENDNQIFRIIGTTDLNSKMNKIPIGTQVIIGLKEEVPTKHANACLIAFVGIIDISEESVG
ncbi:MAG: hypothetical protein J0M15_14970 [Deltaproteobacteria bacterium]|nr:hypothetical protein [Deltaproteobacteria bacterium]